MYVLLAQAAEQTTANDATAIEPGAKLFDVVTQIFAKGDALADPENLLPALSNLSFIWAILFLVVGMVCLFNGYRYYKVCTVMLALFVGAFAGYALGDRMGAGAQWVVAGCLAALLSAVCFPLMKYAVAVLGGLVGALVGANAWSAIAQVARADVAIIENYWIGALIGLIVFGMLSFILFKLSIIFYTSVSGSTIAVLGMIALLLHFPAFKSVVASCLNSHAAVIPLLVLVPAVIGLILQQTSPELKKQGD